MTNDNIQSVIISKKFYNKQQSISIINNYFNIPVKKIYELKDHYKFVQYNSIRFDQYDIVVDTVFVGVEIVVPKKY